MNKNLRNKFKKVDVNAIEQAEADGIETSVLKESTMRNNPTDTGPAFNQFTTGINASSTATHTDNNTTDIIDWNTVSPMKLVETTLLLANKTDTLDENAQINLKSGLDNIRKHLNSLESVAWSSSRPQPRTELFLETLKSAVKATKHKDILALSPHIDGIEHAIETSIAIRAGKQKMPDDALNAATEVGQPKTDDKPIQELSQTGSKPDDKEEKARPLGKQQKQYLHYATRLLDAIEKKEVNVDSESESVSRLCDGLSKYADGNEEMLRAHQQLQQHQTNTPHPIVLGPQQSPDESHLASSAEEYDGIGLANPIERSTASQSSLNHMITSSQSPSNTFPESFSVHSLINHERVGLLKSSVVLTNWHKSVQLVNGTHAEHKLGRNGSILDFGNQFLFTGRGHKQNAKHAVNLARNMGWNTVAAWGNAEYKVELKKAAAKYNIECIEVDSRIALPSAGTNNQNPLADKNMHTPQVSGASERLTRMNQP